MKKKIIIVSIILIMSITYLGYLQFGKDMDVVNSFSLNSSNYKEEKINVILNKVIITENKEEIVNNIIQRVIENGFHTIKFNFDEGYPNKLDVSVYKNKNDMETGNVLFSFSYQKIDDGIGEYDISQYEHMKLEIK